MTISSIAPNAKAGLTWHYLHTEHTSHIDTASQGCVHTPEQLTLSVIVGRLLLQGGLSGRKAVAQQDVLQQYRRAAKEGLAP